jgi:hypothetical protein
LDVSIELLFSPGGLALAGTLATTIGGIFAGLITYRVARKKDKIDLEALGDKTVRDIYDMAERQREELRGENYALRGEVNHNTKILREVEKELSALQGAFDLLQKLQCPLSDRGECPVFHPRRTGMPSTARSPVKLA